MTKLTLFSEPYAPTGNIAAEGFKNLLGRPSLGLLPTVVREAIQNSVDAAIAEAPEVFVRVRDLDEDQVAFLSTYVLPTPADGSHGSLRRVQECLKRRPLRVMEICDFGTTGLGGPTRADVVVSGERSDFVNFMRNVGAPRDTHQGGGTYGYGKSSLYAMSSCATIVVDTVARANGEPVRRVMAAHLGEAFIEQQPQVTAQRRRFTGRHWWGVPDAHDGVDPLEGAAADRIARGLGLPKRDINDTGTTILIVDPQFDEESAAEIADTLVETILWNFWPRMVGSTPAERMLQIKVEVDQQPLHIPDPEQFPPLDLFAQALENIRKGTDSAETIVCQRPKQQLGALSICHGIKARRTGPALRKDSPFHPPSARIALMRPVELVVRYVEGEAFPDSDYEWGGVFRCTDEAEVEEAFARAEPPAHDDWVPANLPKGKERTWVNVAMREIGRKAREYALPRMRSPSSDSSGPSLAQAASKLGSLLDSAVRQGTSISSASSGGRRKAGSSVSVTQPTVSRLEENEDSIFAVFVAEVRGAGSEELTLSAEAYLVADGGATRADGLPTRLAPRVTRIHHLDTGRQTAGDIFCGDQLSGFYEIAVRMADDTAVGLRLKLERRET